MFTVYLSQGVGVGGLLVGKSVRLVIERLQVQILAGATGEFSSPGLTLCFHSYSVPVPPLCYHSGI